MRTINIYPVALQEFTISLSKIEHVILLRWYECGIFFSASSKGMRIVSGVLCRNMTRIIRNANSDYSGGDFFFMDIYGDSDPHYSGLGDRYRLIYIEQGE